MSTLKPLITQEEIEFQFKGQDQFLGDNLANWFCMVNGKEDIPVDKDDRRYCVMFSAQQCFEDLVASGMTTAYWRDLYDWLNADGYAIVTDWLHTKVIEDQYNPKLLDRAPTTTSTQESLEVSLDPTEVILQEAVDSEVPGFMGGWISSTAAGKYLKEVGSWATSPQLSKALVGLGYVKHPGLGTGANAGRSAFKITAEDNRKVRLYVKPDTLAAALQTPKDTTLAYEKAQGYAIKPGTGLNEVFNDGSV